MLTLQHVSYYVAKQITQLEPRGRSTSFKDRKGHQQAGSLPSGFGAEVTTLPPKWVQSTDLLGKDNLGRKLPSNKVTDLSWKN